MATPAASTPATHLAAYRAQRQALDAARAEADAAMTGLLRRYLAALFREQPGLQVVAIAGYQDDEDRLQGAASVATRSVAEAWRVSRRAGPCPENRLDPALVEPIRVALMRFWPTLQRQHGVGWCVFGRRDPAQPDGVALEPEDSWDR